MTTPPAPPQPGDAERLTLAMDEACRLSNKNYTDTDGTQIIVIRRGRLRTVIAEALAACVAEITCLRADAQADTEREQRNHQKWRQDMKRLQATADVQVGEITRLRAELEVTQAARELLGDKAREMQIALGKERHETERLRAEVADYMTRDAAECSTAIEQPEAFPDECEDEGPTPALLAGAALLRSLIPARQPEAGGEDVERAREFIWIIYFEDKDQPPEFFSECGAEAASRARYDQLLTAWNCRLFVEETALTTAWRAGAEAMRDAMIADIFRRAGNYTLVADVNRVFGALPTDTDASG